SFLSPSRPTFRTPRAVVETFGESVIGIDLLLVRRSLHLGPRIGDPLVRPTARRRSGRWPGPSASK
ncbi:MAG: hypothetical protein ACO4B3_04740, partial [Planctomycetota bacterium]